MVNSFVIVFRLLALSRRRKEVLFDNYIDYSSLQKIKNYETIKSALA